MAKVLIIDDEKSILDFLSRQIQRLGHETVGAANCAEARICMADASVQIIVADIFLPDSPGTMEWIDELVEAAGGRCLILITGNPSDEIIDKSRSLESVVLLTKPFELAFIDGLLAKAAGDLSK